MNTHPIPTSFRLRRRKWDVKRERAHKKAAVCGTATPKQIIIFDKAHDRARTAPEQQKTFWHEATHAVLMTMEHKLAYNEPFVTQFGLLLEELIRTARFEEESTP
jgi:hypothetical protein